MREVWRIIKRKTDDRQSNATKKEKHVYFNSVLISSSSFESNRVKLVSFCDQEILLHVRFCFRSFFGFSLPLSSSFANVNVLFMALVIVFEIIFDRWCNSIPWLPQQQQQQWNKNDLARQWNAHRSSMGKRTLYSSQQIKSHVILRDMHLAYPASARAHTHTNNIERENKRQQRWQTIDPNRIVRKCVCTTNNVAVRWWEKIHGHIEKKE